jgi:Spy/CpxP family protein refolding chaperone
MNTVFSLLAFFVISLSDTAAKVPIPADREALLNGEGMGLAAYAELNGYPGPKHVIDLKDQLGLTQDQLKKTEAVMKGVQISAKATGEEIVREEENLHKLFETGKVNERLLRSALDRIGKLRGELRFLHMQAHVKMKGILSPNQIQRYNELRAHAHH